MNLIKKKFEELKTTIGFGVKPNIDKKEAIEALKESDTFGLLGNVAGHSAIQISAEAELAKNIKMNINASVSQNETKVGIRFTKKF